MDSKHFDTENGPVPIPGIDPPANLSRTTWAELKRLSDTFRETEIEGPGICLNCRIKGEKAAHPVEDMYIVMESAQADAVSGKNPQISPFFIGTCRRCAPEMYEAQMNEDRMKKGNRKNLVVLAFVALVCLALLYWVT